MPSEWVASLSEVPKGSMVRRKAGGVDVLIAHCDDGVVRAVVDQCTHEAAALSEGWLDGCEVECPQHLARFDLRDGEALCAPAWEPVRVVAVVVDGDDVYVEGEAT